jgi:hypothetical protein
MNWRTGNRFQLILIIQNLRKDLLSHFNFCLNPAIIATVLHKVQKVWLGRIIELRKILRKLVCLEYLEKHVK